MHPITAPMMPKFMALSLFVSLAEESAAALSSLDVATETGSPFAGKQVTVVTSQVCLLQNQKNPQPEVPTVVEPAGQDAPQEVVVVTIVEAQIDGTTVATTLK